MSAVTDQLQAAVDHATLVLSQEDGTGKTLYHTNPLPDHLREQWEAAMTVGPFAACASFNPDSPSVMFGIAADPGKIYCPECYPDVEFRYTEQADDTCDLCGDEDTQFYGGTCQFGFALLSYWACRPCGERMKSDG